MPEYDIDFAAKLAKVADNVDEHDPWAHDARRVTIYLGRLSAELTMKALLEQAGVPIASIRARNHNLRKLLEDTGQCEVEVEIAPGTRQWVSASRVRAVSIDLGLAQVPIGAIIDAENDGASQYPNKIRYGEIYTDFDPWLVSQMALLLSEWAQTHWSSIRRITVTANTSVNSDAPIAARPLP